MKIEIKQCGWKLDSFNEIVEKAIDVKAESAFRPYSYTCESDLYFTRATYPTTTKSHTHDLSIKNSKAEKCKTWI